MSFSSRVPRVLLVEDSEDDAFFFRRVVIRSGIPCELTHVTDGLAAVAVLKQAIPDAMSASFRPDLIFLDLKMPDFDGFEVLSWVRNHSFVPQLNIVVLSGSEDATDIQKARSLGAMACFAKPIQGHQLRTILDTCRLVPSNGGEEDRIGDE